MRIDSSKSKREKKACVYFYEGEKDNPTQKKIQTTLSFTCEYPCKNLNKIPTNRIQQQLRFMTKWHFSPECKDLFLKVRPY